MKSRIFNSNYRVINSKTELGLDLPGVLEHVIKIQILIVIVPPYDIKIMVVIEHII